MSKYKIGDHVRVTTQDPYFDKCGPVVSLDGNGKFKFGVKLDDDAPLWFQEHELILADPEPHTPSDPVNSPSHYTSHPSGVECLTITRHMGFNLGNAVKYIWRADLKGNAIQDLEKAIVYIRDEINKREGKL